MPRASPAVAVAGRTSPGSPILLATCCRCSPPDERTSIWRFCSSLGIIGNMTDSPAEAPRTKGRYPKGIARRQEILDKAIEVFAVRGSQKTSLRAIAQEVGVTHAALTHYFGSLEELLVEVYRESQHQPGRERPTPPDASPALAMSISAEANREIPGLVQLYTTLVAMSLEDNHPIAQRFATERFA